MEDGALMQKLGGVAHAMPYTVILWIRVVEKLCEVPNLMEGVEVYTVYLKQ